MVTSKKTTAKSSVSKSKTAKAKSTSKKTTPTKVAKSKTATTTDKNSGSVSLLGWLVAVLMAGALVGTYVSDVFWMDKFDEEASMLVIDDITWMPVGGSPVTVVVLNDASCGDRCNTESSLNSLRASVNPALKVEEVDINSAEGLALIETFNLVSVPQYFFGEDIENLEAEGADGEEVRFVDNLPPGLLTKSGELYYIDSAQVGFKPGKFITQPEFADLETEPSKGSGPVTVVEFSNYQCSFCKRFHDQNIDLIDQLVAENKITYIVKDYPMFQANDRFAHRAANCVLEQGGNEPYWEMNDTLFATQGEWSQMGESEAYFTNMASELGYEVSSCMQSSEIESEIMADMSEGSRYGVSGTPTVFVGTQILPGAVGPAVLRSAVESELNN